MELGDCYLEESDRKSALARLSGIKERMKATSDLDADRFFSSSGRAEIIGNHTDHNMGKVIVSAISCDIVCAVKARDDNLIEICSDGFRPIRFNLSDTAMRPSERGKSYALARGAIAAIKKRGYKFGGFTAYTHSNIYRGSGVSSSAAFEVLIAEIVNSLYLSGALTAFDKAKIGQFAENVYFGKPCGLLDQTGIALGGMNRVDFSSYDSPQVDPVSPPEGYDIFIVNTGGSHSSLTEHYTAIRADMNKISRFFKRANLREIGYDEFFSALPALKKRVSERAILRAFHYYEENDRVDSAFCALKRGDSSAFLDCIDRSGESSLCYLQNAFVPGSSVQPIALGIKVAKRIIRDGAVRLHGGGFAGTVIAYVAKGESDRFRSEMSAVFGAENVFSTYTRKIGACEITL